jgi:hypothetical protein
METNSEWFKCSGCRCIRNITEYEIYKGQRRKTCIKCGEKRKRNKK